MTKIGDTVEGRLETVKMEVINFDIVGCKEDIIQADTVLSG